MARYRYQRGMPILSDRDPMLGSIIKWHVPTERVKIRFWDGRYGSRSARCVFLRGSDDNVHQFSRGTLLCKVSRFPLLGNPLNRRVGEVYVTRWHQTYSTAYQGRHSGGTSESELYAIVVDGRLVYRPFEYQEISAALPMTAGHVHEGLCTEAG